MDRDNRKFLLSKIIALLIAIGFSCLCGWGYLHFSLTFTLFGSPGGLAYLMISQTGSEDGAAKIILELLYLIVNTAFYFFVIRFIQKRIAHRTTV
jgi:hypothetical protein